MKICYTIFKNSFCPIIFAADSKGLIHIHLDTGEGKRLFKIDSSWVINNENKILQLAKAQIQEFFLLKRQSFNLPLNPDGTEFQKQVWNAVKKIPFGKTMTYKEIAQIIGKPKAARAVGFAVSKNPLPLVIPCHRVIGSSGKLTGFAHGLLIKKRLLDLEYNQKL